MLFAGEMLGVYTRFFTHMRWNYSQIECDKSDIGGIRSAKLKIYAPDSFRTLVQEAGVHRVQRVPKTEKSGRMHTSTITIAVTPNAVFNVTINEKDLEMQAKRASGPGGQHVNKTDSAIRLLHKPTGIAVESQESRYQIDNRKTAMRKLLEKLQALELKRITEQTLAMRKTQLGNADRNEKIRTYNFPQDRITDHRLGKSYHNLRGLMSGDVSVLQRVIEDFH